MPKPPKIKSPGRPRGSADRRTVEGGSFARDVLMQDEKDLRRDEASGEVAYDRHPEAIRNPVLRRLRAQARLGLGNKDGMLPPSVFLSIADRSWGKVSDKILVQNDTAKAFAEETDEDLARRAAELAGELGVPVDADLLTQLKPGEGN